MSTRSDNPRGFNRLRNTDLELKARMFFGGFVYTTPASDTGSDIACELCFDQDHSATLPGAQLIRQHLRTHHPMRYWIGRLMPGPFRPNYLRRL